MEHDDAVQLLRVVHAQDNLALFVRTRVAFACKDHADGPLVGPFQLHVLRTAVGHCPHDVHQVGLQARQDHLRLRVAEARVEFEHLRAFFGQHEAAVEHAAIVVRERFARRGGRRGLHDVHHGRQLFVGHDGHRRVHAHAARVRTAVAVEGALVVLRRGHAERAAARDERQKRAFRTRHALFDNDRGASLAERACKAVVHGLFCVFDVLGHDNALARRKAVSLHDDRRTKLVDVRKRCRFVREALVTGGRNAVCLHELFAVGFAPLQLGTLRIGAEHGHARFAQHVGNARHERRLGANDHQANRMLLSERQHRLPVFGVEAGDVFRNGRRAAVAGSNVKLLALRGLGERPCDSVLTAARSKKQNIHEGSFLPPARRQGHKT